MKKLMILSLLVALLTSLSVPALAESPAEPILLTTSDVIGAETLYRLYDREFYEAKADQPGQVVRLDYTTDVYGQEGQKRWANVYVPSCYDPDGTDRINVIYFFHGNNCDQKVLLGNEATCNAFDHMISTGIADPFIVVAPTYYINVRTKEVDLDLFVREIRESLMPAVESAYRTYAETPDDAGFRASRDHRAFTGFSRGGMTTWFLFDKLLDYSYYFLPFSGATSDLTNAKVAMDSGSEYAHDFFIYMATGGPEDMAYEGSIALAKTMLAEPEYFSFGTEKGENNFYLCISDNIHQDLTSRYYLFNAFIDILFKD